MNSIIVHKFDFSDEEIMAYYISFLKTLSLKLNNHTVHFFYNEVSKESCSIMIRGLELEIDRSVAHNLFSLLCLAFIMAIPVVVNLFVRISARAWLHPLTAMIN